MQKVIKLVDEKRGIVQCTISDDRWYLKPIENKVTGLPEFLAVPSVTWVGGFWPKGVGFYKWLAEKGWDEAEAIKVAAGDKGSAVHHAVDMILQGLEFRADTKVPDYGKVIEGEPLMRELTWEELKCVVSFVDWRKEVEEQYTIEVLAHDKTLFSEIHNVAGTLDAFLRLTHKTTGEVLYYIIDFKTSKSIWIEQELQVSAYKKMVENGENPIHELNPNGTEKKELVDVSNVQIAILQLGYNMNKKGFKFTVIEDKFDLFEVAKQIWKAEVKDSNAGFTRREFPLVLSPKREAPKPAAEVTKVGPPAKKLGRPKKIIQTTENNHDKTKS